MDHERGDSSGLTFIECVSVCAGQRGLIKEFDRLTGHHLSTIGTRRPLDSLIDEATGRDDEAFAAFIEFVWDCVWTRLDLRGEAVPMVTRI